MDVSPSLVALGDDPDDYSQGAVIDLGDHLLFLPAGTHYAFVEEGRWPLGEIWRIDHRRRSLAAFFVEHPSRSPTVRGLGRGWSFLSQSPGERRGIMGISLRTWEQDVMQPIGRACEVARSASAWNRAPVTPTSPGFACPILPACGSSSKTTRGTVGPSLPR